MSGADMIIATDFYSGDNVTVEDCQWRVSTSIQPTNMPTLDPIQNIIWYTWNQTDSQTTMTFARDLVTNDTEYDNGIFGEQLLIWSHGDPKKGDPNTLSYHGNNRGSSIINFFGTGLVLKEDQMKFWHGSLMMMAFLFCMSFGAFVARYMKEFYWWFPLHIFLQVLGVMGAIVGFTLAIIMTKGPHFSNLHAWFGLITVSLSVLAPALGWASHITYNPSRSRTPIWPDKLHWWIGRFTILLSYATIFLVMRQIQTSVALQAFLWITVGIYLIIYICLDIYRRSNSTSDHHEKATLLVHNE